QHEERHGQQREAVGALDGVLREDLRVEHPHVPHQRGAAGEQRERDRDAQCHGAQQRAQENGDGHGCSPCGMSSDSFTPTSSLSSSLPASSLYISCTMTMAASTANMTPLT